MAGDTSCLLKFLLFFLILGCSDVDELGVIFQPIQGEKSGFAFENNIMQADSISAYDFLYMYNGSGVAIADFNNDGLKDVVMGGNNISDCRIYLNLGGLKFEELSITDMDELAWVHGVTVVDINQDGLEDIYLSVGGVESSVNSRNRLFINQGDLNFKDLSYEYGLADSSLTTHTIFLDYDKDGDLDAYLLNYENNPSKDPNAIRPKDFSGSRPSQDRFYKNIDGRFYETTSEVGINQEGYGLGVLTSDFNNDGWLDIYVSNDFSFDDLLYINQKDGTFKESLKEFFSHTSNFGMGVDMADINNDGFSDLFQVDMLPEDNRRQKKLLGGMNYDRQQLLANKGYLPQYMRNTLQLNTGKLSFQEISYLSGVSMSDWSWSPLIVDMNNDGLKDIFITNGYFKDVTDIDFRDYVVNETRKINKTFDRGVLVNALNNLKGEKVSNYLFENSNGLEFVNSSQDWGLGELSFSNGAAYGDLDNDGDLELVVNNLNHPSFLYENLTSDNLSNNYLQLDLKVKGNYQLAIGTKVVVNLSSGRQLTMEVNPYRGFQSSVDPTLNVGFLDGETIEEVKLVWPDMSESRLHNIEPNSKLILDKDRIESSSPKKKERVVHAFVDGAVKKGIDFTHQESDFVDFKQEAMLPHKLSTEGPVSAVGDVNGDGLEDIFIGGSAGFSGSLYIQEHGIQGASFKLTPLEDQKESEDSGAVFFDADSDGDLDLYVVSGSNEFPFGDERYLDRLYLNDGDGHFFRSKNRLPVLYFSGSVVVSNDFDNDGDLDLFVGGRLNPGNYPKQGMSQLLINENGVFVDMIDKYAPGLKTIGMVKDAKWVDLFGDKRKELIIAGEFMPVTVYGFLNDDYQMSRLSSSLDQYQGWWNTFEVVDIEGDGDLDIVAGNLGLNSRYKATVNAPLRVYANDFDQNGSMDAIITYVNDNNEYPLADRATMIQQLPFVKKKFVKNLKYAESTIDEVLPRSILSNAYQLEATHFQSSFIINKGNGVFDVKPMPLETQMSIVNDIVVFDYDHDEIEDILLVGNSFATEVFTGNYDAQAGILLKGLGNGEFKTISLFGSGFQMRGQISNICKLTVDGSPYLLTLSNSDDARLYQVCTVDWNTQANL